MHKINVYSLGYTYVICIIYLYAWAYLLYAYSYVCRFNIIISNIVINHIIYHLLTYTNVNNMFTNFNDFYHKLIILLQLVYSYLGMNQFKMYERIEIKFNFCSNKLFLNLVHILFQQFILFKKLNNINIIIISYSFVGNSVLTVNTYWWKHVYRVYVYLLGILCVPIIYYTYNYDFANFLNFFFFL